MKKYSFKKTFPSQISLIKPVLNEIMEYLTYAFPFMSPDDYFDCKLIYAELLVNAVVHGNKNDENKKVTVTINIINDHCFSSIVEDEGNGFNYEDILDKISSKDALYLERGRGIQIVKSLTNELHYNLYKKQIQFTKRMKYNG
ncbi:MAG TPA: ATP-binding protein [Defluviitaleaceae bacterium]|nr:ATP-binding protein [Candidatus Epulonipiscium sp.]HPT76289.1 ATP-binding protein [Defluviitaleaceae bacterium]HQD50669.1 ATP-binding protein [Defluviitaleaceae bacterium]